jgi:tRNA threonylcarbamoyladenosine biosynthesis protein TsaE
MKILNYTFDEIEKAAHFINENGASAKIWCFIGEMGSGKTTLIKAICNILNATDHVSSPTFALVNEYETSTNQVIYHFDLYRLKNIEEALDIGIEEYLSSGNLCLIEWPEIIENILPKEIMTIFIESISANARKISIK